MADTSPILDTQIYVKIFSSMDKAGSQMSTSLVADGTALAFVLFGVLIFYRSFQMAIGDGPAAVAKFVNDIFKLGIVLMLLATWGTIVLTTFTSEFTDIAKKVAASQGSVDVGASTYGAIQRVWNGNDHGDGPECTTVEFGETSGIDGVDPNSNDKTTSKVSDCKSKAVKELPLWKAILLIPMAFMHILLKLLVILGLLILFAIYLVQVNIGMVLTWSGMAVGPILVPFFLWSATEFLFNGWLKFMIVAGLFKVIGAIISVMVDVAVKTAFNVANQVVGDTADLAYFDMVALVTVAIICLVGIVLMMQVPMIAQGMVSGHAGMAGNGMFQTFKQGAKTAVNTVKSAASSGGM